MAQVGPLERYLARKQLEHDDLQVTLVEVKRFEHAADANVVATPRDLQHCKQHLHGQHGPTLTDAYPKGIHVTRLRQACSSGTADERLGASPAADGDRVDGGVSNKRRQHRGMSAQPNRSHDA